MFRTPVLALSLAGALMHAAPGARAAPPTPARLPVVTVTPTRTAVSVDESLAAVTVIQRADIERWQAASVPEALSRVPGLGMTNNGGPGKATSVFLRGTNSDHVLVMVDGVRIGSATLGSAAFQDLPIHEVERIEVVRGPRSALYGSEAIGGVIQIFTRRGGGPLAGHASLGAGSHRAVRASAGVSGGSERAWFNVSGSQFDTQGFNACDGAPFPPGGGCFTNEPDHDAYRNRAGSARAGVRLGHGGSAEVSYLRARGDSEYDGSPFSVNETESLQEVLGTRVVVHPARVWTLTATAGRSRDDSDNYFNGAFRTRFDTTRTSAGVQNDLALHPDHLLTVGADWLHDEVGSTTQYAKDSRHVRGAYAQYQARVAGHDLLAGARHDDNQQFGGHTTGNVGWGHDLGSVRLTASLGTAFKAPTFNQLYFPFDFGNPDLEPERSRSVEAGVAGTHGRVRWSVNAYETRIEDLIDFDFSLIPNSINVDTARIRGVEGVASTRLWGWELSGNLTAQDPRNRGSDAQRGKLLPRRAQLMAQLDADRRFGDWSAGFSVHAQGRRYDDIDNTRRLGAFALLDLRAAWALTDALTLEGKIANLLDKHYRTVDFYIQDGRNFWLTVRYTPGRR